MNYKKYVAPAVEIITMQTEGMIAGSAPNESFGAGSHEGFVNATDTLSVEIDDSDPF